MGSRNRPAPKDHKNGTNYHPVWHTDMKVKAGQCLELSMGTLMMMMKLIMLVLGFDYVVKMMLCRWFYVMGRLLFVWCACCAVWPSAWPCSAGGPCAECQEYLVK